MTKTELFVEVLKKHALTGISKESLMSATKSTESSIYTLVSKTRRKNRLNIIQKDGKYYIGPGKAQKKEKRTYTRHAPTNNLDDLPFNLPKHHSRLPEDKRGQFFDMIGQAAFYWRCAEALIHTEQLKATLTI